MFEKIALAPLLRINMEWGWWARVETRRSVRGLCTNPCDQR